MTGGENDLKSEKALLQEAVGGLTSLHSGPFHLESRYSGRRNNLSTIPREHRRSDIITRHVCYKKCILGLIIVIDHVIVSFLFTYDRYVSFIINITV